MTELDLSVIAPCFNEEQNVAELTRRVLRVFERGGLEGELILVEDGSRDGTRAAIEGLVDAHPGRVVGCYHAHNRGLAQAWKTGVRAARAGTVAIMDSDLQYQPEDLLRLWRALREYSVDIVQGWRSPVGRERDHRYLLSRGFNSMLNVAFGMSLRDNKSGFVMCDKGVLEDLLSYRGQYAYWQSFLMVAARAKGYSYKEVETLFEQRRAGRSFLDGRAWHAVAKSFSDLAIATWEYRWKGPPPDVGAQFLERHRVVDRTPPKSARSRAHFRTYLRAFDQTHWMITKDVEKHYEVLQKTQWLGTDQVKQLQDEKLRRLIRHAYRNVPYYRERMKAAGLRPEDIRGQADLHKLPLLTKQDVREQLYFDILSENHDKAQVLRVTTSGSTGEPFVCYADRSQLEFRWAATLRSQEWTGYEFGDPTVRLWHQTLGMTPAQVARERADAFLSRRKLIPIFEMSDARVEQALGEIAAWRPTLLDGYAEALDFLARYLQKQGSATVRPKAIMTSAQTLPDTSRRVIEQAFGCKVFDKYGAREFSGIAYECEAHAGHHLVAEGYLVEVLRGGQPAKPGEVGEVVITDLNNFCLPFIRYRIGDLAVAMADDQVCACGRGLPRLGNIEGRVQSIIRGTGGRWVPGSFFAHYMRDLDHAVARFQVEQEREGAITLRLVKGGRYSDEVLEEICTVFRKHLGPDLQIDVEFVDDVAMVRTGKRVASVSRLGLDFQLSPPGVRSGNGSSSEPS